MIETTQKQTFIFIGRSGCGKGTQADLLRNYFQKQTPEIPFLYIETGEKFREFIKGQTFTQKMSFDAYKKNNRQPDFLAAWMWGHILIEDFRGEEHLMFDGAPRSLTEAKILDTALAFFQREKVYVIYLNIERQTAVERLLARGRTDDASKMGIDKRLDWFESDVLPAIDFYKSNPRYALIEVNGEEPVSEVHRAIVEAL